MSATRSFSGCVLHQVSTEARHHAYAVLFWIAWLMLRLWQRQGDVLGRHDETLMPFIEIVTACIGVGIIHQCVHADAPANEETASLTRPTGRGAMMLGKVMFLLLGVLLPFVVAESLLWRGFEHGLAQWLALTAGTFLAGGFILALAFVISAMSRTRAQAAAAGFGVLVLVSAATFVVQGLERNWLPWLKSMFERADFMRMNSGIVAAIFALVLCAVGGWLCFVPRRRGWAALLVLCAFVQEPLTTSMRQRNIVRRYDWLELPERGYDGALKLHVGMKSVQEAGPVQVLWPTLRLSGLRDDEAASVVALAPIKPQEPEHLWPPEKFYTDTPLVRGRGDVWASNDHVRVLMRQAPAATLWLQGYDCKLSEHHWLRNDLKPCGLDLSAAQTQKWRLRLAIHGVKRFASLPLREMWDAPHTFLLRPGLRLECERITNRFASSGTWHLNGHLHHSRSALIAEGKYRPKATKGAGALPPAVLFVLQDAELRECTVHDLKLNVAGYKGMTPDRERSYAWQIDKATGLHVQIAEPEAQFEILHSTREDWISRTTASFYELEERGSIDLELSAEEMAEVLVEAPEEVKKS